MSDTPNTTPSLRPWSALIPMALMLTLALSALIIINAGNSARFNDGWLREAADHVRAQMNGSPADQIDRTVLPPRGDLIVYRGWTLHENDQWAMCLNTGEIDDDNETRHLIFAATGPYTIRDGACPSTRTLTTTQEREQH